jgi:hypothetical protein
VGSGTVVIGVAAEVGGMVGVAVFVAVGVGVEKVGGRVGVDVCVGVAVGHGPSTG